ncbi:MAG: BatA domain-containing protein [Flavobacteriaceae bacterium]|nr:BatA domain-containing protein [Flavobacteriaceae bacterium]
MQFKHPFILFALFLLILPIIVHFFQLQQFTRIRFTNVQFLKNLVLKNRKSSHLKKLLVLFSRLALFAFLILAFAQPFYSKKKAVTKTNNIIYLDNSYSMQSKFKTMNLFNKAVQDLIKFPHTSSTITLLDNNETFKNLTLSQLKSQVSKLKLSPSPFKLENALLRISNLSQKQAGETNAFIISDFQINKAHKTPINFNSQINYKLVKLQHKHIANMSIDSVYLLNKDATNVSIRVLLKNSNFETKNIAVSLFNNNLLLAKTSVKSVKNKLSSTEFTIANDANFRGKITIEDQSLKLDNTLYFVLTKPKKINVLSIGKNSKPLAKLYSGTEFNHTQKALNTLDYTKINKQHLILLNAAKNIPKLLATALKRFINNGGTLVVIPDMDSDINSYNSFFNLLNIKNKLTKVNQEHQITKINYAHPLLTNVFEKQVKNFDYPTVTAYYNLNISNSNSVLKLDNGSDFISQIPIKNGTLYFVAAPLEAHFNTLVNSPLIVPIFYNAALQTTPTNRLYYTLDQHNKIAVNTILKKDEVLSISDDTNSFIPLQRIQQNTVILETDKQPDKAGFYTVLNTGERLQNLAFNINRNEGIQKFYTEKFLKKSKNTSYFTSVSEAMQSFKDSTSVFELWQLCLALVLLFFIIELLLLKHFTS